EREHRLVAAAAGLAGIADAALDETQTEVLLRLLDIALAARVAGSRDVPLVGAAYGVRLTLVPAPGRVCTMSTAGGALHLDGFTVEITEAAHTATRAELVPA